MGKQYPGSPGAGILDILSIVQFAVVIFLLAFSLIISRQLAYVNSKDLGYQTGNIYVIRIPANQPGGNILRDEIKKRTGIISACTVHHHPADVFQQMEFEANGKRFPFVFRMVDTGVFKTLDIDILRTFGHQTNRIVNGWVINETFYRHLLSEFSEEDIAASNFNVGNEDPGPVRFCSCFSWNS